MKKNMWQSSICENRIVSKTEGEIEKHVERRKRDEPFELNLTLPFKERRIALVKLRAFNSICSVRSTAAF